MSEVEETGLFHAMKINWKPIRNLKRKKRVRRNRKTMKINKSNILMKNETKAHSRRLMCLPKERWQTKLSTKNGANLQVSRPTLANKTSKKQKKNVDSLATSCLSWHFRHRGLCALGVWFFSLLPHPRSDGGLNSTNQTKGQRGAPGLTKLWRWKFAGFPRYYFFAVLTLNTW